MENGNVVTMTSLLLPATNFIHIFAPVTNLVVGMISAIVFIIFICYDGDKIDCKKSQKYTGPFISHCKAHIYLFLSSFFHNSRNEMCRQQELPDRYFDEVKQVLTSGALVLKISSQAHGFFFVYITF